MQLDMLSNMCVENLIHISAPLILSTGAILTTLFFTQDLDKSFIDQEEEKYSLFRVIELVPK